MFIGQICLKRKKIKQCEIFDQSHGLTPLEKRNFCDFFKSKFLWSKKASFLYRTSPNTFSWRNVPKRKENKFQILDENHGLTTFKKMQILGPLSIGILMVKKG